MRRMPCSGERDLSYKQRRIMVCRVVTRGSRTGVERFDIILVSDARSESSMPDGRDGTLRGDSEDDVWVREDREDIDDAAAK